MSSSPTPEGRKIQAERALTELETLPTEPVSVRIAMAVRLTGIGRSTLYELIKSGEIETVKVGRSTLIPFRCLKKLVGN
jgi:excisionase family DNA binding protein